jgi:hypothetical protein
MAALEAEVVLVTTQAASIAEAVDVLAPRTFG